MRERCSKTSQEPGLLNYVESKSDTQSSREQVRKGAVKVGSKEVHHGSKDLCCYVQSNSMKVQTIYPRGSNQVHKQLLAFGDCIDTRQWQHVQRDHKAYHACKQILLWTKETLQVRPKQLFKGTKYIISAGRQVSSQVRMWLLTIYTGR